MSQLKIDPKLFIFLFAVTIVSGTISWIGDSVFGKIGLIIFSVLLVTYSIYKPTYGIYFLAFSIPIESLSLISLNLNLFKLIGVSTFIGWFIHFWVAKKKQVFFSSEMAIALLLVVMGFASYFWADFSQQVALKRAITLLLFVGYFCLISQIITSKSHLEHVIAANLTGSTILLVLGLMAAYSIANGIDMGSYYYGFNFTLFGANMALACFFLWMKFLALKDLKKQVLVAIILTLILVVTSIISPVAFGLISMILVLGSLKPLLKKHYTRTVSYFGVIIFIIIATLAISPITFNGTKDIMNFDETASLWQDLEVHYSISPILGVGLGNIDQTSIIQDENPGYVIIAGADIFQDNRTQTHIYIETLVELGVIGFLILVYLILTILKKGSFMIMHLKESSSSWLIAATLFSYVIFVMSIDLFAPMIQRKMMWFALAMIVVSSRVFMRELKQGLHKRPEDF